MVTCTPTCSSLATGAAVRRILLALDRAWADRGARHAHVRLATLARLSTHSQRSVWHLRHAAAAVAVHMSPAADGAI